MNEAHGRKYSAYWSTVANFNARKLQHKEIKGKHIFSIWYYTKTSIYDVFYVTFFYEVHNLS